MTNAPVFAPALTGCGLFKDLSELEFNAVAAFLEPIRIKAGQCVFREGDAGEALFILVGGHVAAYKTQSDGTERWMFDVKNGDFFGEMSIIAHEPRSATLIVKEDAEVMALQGIDFYRIVFDHPMIGIKMLQAIISTQNVWLDQNSQHLGDLMRWGETARKRAITDELTGLYNRRFLEDSVKDRFEHGAVNLRQIALLMMDMDKVHAINDKHGQSGGDAVICATADILRNVLRSGDIAARLSGDEFSVLLGDTGEEEARMIAEQIREAVEKTEVLVPARPGAEEKTPIKIAVSIGIAGAPRNAQTADGLFRVSDEVLRRAKEAGRNRVVSA